MGAGPRDDVGGGEAEAVRERHGAFYLQLAEAAHAAARAGTGAAAFERLEPEHDNLRSALAWSGESKAERMLRLAGALGEFWFERGFWNEGHQWLERALARQVGDWGPMSQSLPRPAQRFEQQGYWARALLEESVELARTAKNRYLLFWALVGLAEVLSQQGDPERASSLREECLLLARKLGTPSHAGVAIGLLVAHVSSYEEAVRMVEQAAGGYGPDVVGGTLYSLAACARLYEEALRMVDQDVRDYGPAAAIPELGAQDHAARERGDYGWAATCYRRSLALRQEAGDPFVFAQSLEDFGGLAARQQQWERAARLLGAAEGACRALVWTLPVAVPEEYERAVRGTRDALGEEAFASAWAVGRALSVEEAIRVAVEERS